MLLLRALNEYDIITNPLINGISSKKMIYDIVKKHLENNGSYSNLNDEDIKNYIETNRNKILIMSLKIPSSMIKNTYSK